MYSYEFPQEYLKRVKETHETGGGYGSVGSVASTRYMKLVLQQLTVSHCLCLLRYQYEWKLEEAQKNILRTHTTAVSARMLYKLGQQVYYI